MDGQVYRGANNRAGEIGDWPCALGSLGISGASPPGQAFVRLEEIASLQSLLSSLAGRGAEAASPTRALRPEPPLDALVQAALAGDKVVLEFLDRVAQAFGLVLNQLSCAFDAEKIILAGALAAFGDNFQCRLRESLRKFGPPGALPEVVVSELGSFNGAIGAAALAVQQWKPVPA